MVEFVPYRPEHLRGLVPPDMDPRYALALDNPGLTWTGLAGLRVIGCAGIVAETAWRGTAWAIFAPDVPWRAWPAITAQAATILNRAHARGLHRIAIDVSIDFYPGMVWARRLGFEPDGIARGWLQNGGDAIIYSHFSPPSRAAAAPALPVRREPTCETAASEHAGEAA